MATVTIVPEKVPGRSPGFRASQGGHQLVGLTPGAVLDAFSEQFPDADASTFVIVQHLRPDAHFTQTQMDRLAALQAVHRASVKAGVAMTASDRAEYESLIEAELDAAVQRSAAMARAAGK